MKKVKYDDKGMIEGDLIDEVPKGYRLKAIWQRFCWIHKQSATWIAYILLIIFLFQLRLISQQQEILGSLS